MELYIWCGILILLALVVVGTTCWQAGYARGADEVADFAVKAAEEALARLEQMSGRREENEHEDAGGEQRD